MAINSIGGRGHGSVFSYGGTVVAANPRHSIGGASSNSNSVGGTVRTPAAAPITVQHVTPPSPVAKAYNTTASIPGSKINTTA